MSQKKRRSKLLVDREVQGVLLRRLALHWIVAFVVTILYLFCLQLLANGFQKPLGEQFRDTWQQHGSLLVVLVTLFPVFLYDSLRMSHRFAGPMVSFRKSVNRLAQGESIGEVRFRKGDYWNDLAASLNQVAGRLGQLKPESQAGPTS